MPEQATWTVARLSGGGYRQAQLSHALGRFLWLTGPGGKEVVASRSLVLDSPVEHRGACPLRVANGAIGTIVGGSAHLGYGDNKNELAMSAIGSEGRLACDLRRNSSGLSARGEDVRLPVRDGEGVYDCDGPANALVDLAPGRDVRNWAPGGLGVRTVEISTPSS